ncbi:MAG: Bax inhibitor-1 family protein [Cardiobacteriaceae bacterium]|nr:Bax inhibitor-1 family protein [Cardiobacteriaceae bacterium]
MLNLQKMDTAHLSQESLLSRHKVLRQTYMLLGMNLLFSAICAFIGVKMGGFGIPPWLMMVGMIGLSIGIQMNRNSGVGIVLLFALTGLLGLFLSKTLALMFGFGMGNVVVKALAGTAILFFGLSAYVIVSGKNFSFLGGFLFVGSMILMLAVLGMMLFGMTGGQVAISAAFLFLSSAYVLYDTSNIIHGEETNYIVATLNLFINIFNMFVSLLNIIMAFNGNRE